jgi:hypothetical protein
VALLLTGILALAVVAERWRWFAGLLGIAMVDRAWIWSADPPRLVEPRAFYAARDFELASPPAEAELEVLGDPEYIVYLNGTRVGSGRAATEPEFDRYRVAPLLRNGRNRIVLELRSPIGSGAATLRLADGEGRVLVATDADWLVYRSSWRGLLTGDPFFETGRVSLLAHSPFARWADAAPGPVRPLFSEASTGAIEPALAVRTAATESWRPLPPQSARRRRLGGRIEVDFGREVLGYLYLAFNHRAPTRGLLRFGSEPIPSGGWNSDAVVLAPANRGSWQDAIPRRFRYVELIGVEEVTRIDLLQVSEAAFRRLPADSAPTGLFGLETRPVRLPMIDEIWRKYGLPSSALSDPAPGAKPKLKPGGGERRKARAPKPGARRRQEVG